MSAMPAGTALWERVSAGISLGVGEVILIAGQTEACFFLIKHMTLKVYDTLLICL